MLKRKCDKCRDGYLIVKYSKKTGYCLGCTNYKINGTGCSKSVGMKYYYDQMHYSMDDDVINSPDSDRENLKRESKGIRTEKVPDKNNLNNNIENDYRNI